MAVEPIVLVNRERYERVMDGFTDNTHDDALTHTVRLAEGAGDGSDPDRALELSVVALPSPEYTIRAARARALGGDVDPAVVDAVSKLAGVRMIAGLTRTVAVVVNGGAGPAPGAAERTQARGVPAPGGAGTALIVDAAVEVARLARQVGKLPRERAERAADGDPLECWQLDTTGWIDLPDSCFTYSEAGRALFGTRTITTAMRPDLYSPRPGQTRVFERRKVARIERIDGRLRLFHSMHDNVHGFELTFEIDAATGRIVRADSITPRLPYAGMCSEPQAKIKGLIGETVDAGLRRRLSAHVGGTSGCAQLFDLTADLLKLLA